MDLAISFVTNNRAGGWYAGFRGQQQVAALNLMTAHLAALMATINAGDYPGFVQQASIDKISVTLTPPPQTSQWQWWLNQTPYGAQLLALLQVVTAGGFFVTAGQPSCPPSAAASGSAMAEVRQSNPRAFRSST